MEREAVLVGIDVGTSKVCALIGEVSRDGRLTIMGHGTVPCPMIVNRPSRLISPIRAQTFVVPTSIPTRTASLSTVRSVSWLA